MDLNGEKTGLFTLKNKNNMVVKITNYGGKIVSIMVPDKNGKFGDVVLVYDNIEQTVKGNPYFGALIGRYANRIARGKFSINGKQYSLKINDGYNALHGGIVGYNDVVWVAKQEGNKLILKHHDPDMHEGYPGNVDVIVIYELTDNNELKIFYSAVTDKPTIINLTNHAFFNLHGEGIGTILDQKLMINADYYTPIDTTSIPTGKIARVKGTPLDFRTLTEIGKRINDDNQQLKNGHGYDHNFVLNGKNGVMKLAAKVVDPKTGRILEVYTTQPGLQFYSGNFLDGTDIGKGGKKYEYRTAFCLETQHFPDSPNHKNFPSTLLRPGGKFLSETIYKFGVEK